MSYKLVIKDAFWQILGRIFSAIGGFIVIKIISPYLGPLRFGDYSTILKYFAIWSALADFGLYVVALREIGKMKNKLFGEKNNKEIIVQNDDPEDTTKLETVATSNNDSGTHKHVNSSTENYNTEEISTYYSKFVTSRFVNVIVVYGLALTAAYFVPSYISNPYIAWGLPLGMAFSASFMMAGIIQLPLQLYWKMEHLSIALIISRISQIIILVGMVLAFPHFSSDNSAQSIFVFQIIQFSVFMSGFVQGLYVYFVGRKYIKLKWIFDYKFTINHIKNNFRYGLAYYLSSFHTLVVLILLSIIFPTSEGNIYVGIWSVALALIEILLIVPSSLGNSILHRISAATTEEKMKSFGSLMLLNIWIGGVFLINFALFDSSIIHFVSGSKYVTTATQLGADYVLPFLGIVLVLSFIKQVFNYIFVANEIQNKLFNINLFGVIVGVGIGLPFIIQYNIWGGVFTQVLLEVLFVTGALFIAYKNNSLPKFDIKYLFLIIAILVILYGLGKIFINIQHDNFIMFVVYAAIFNLILMGISYKPVKNIVKNL